MITTSLFRAASLSQMTMLRPEKAGNVKTGSPNDVNLKVIAEEGDK